MRTRRIWRHLQPRRVCLLREKRAVFWGWVCVFLCLLSLLALLGPLTASLFASRADDGLRTGRCSARGYILRFVFLFSCMRGSSFFIYKYSTSNGEVWCRMQLLFSVVLSSFLLSSSLTTTHDKPGSTECWQSKKARRAPHVENQVETRRKDV
jgi:hypothetical protein